MPKRWYISPIVGTGADDDPYRAKVGSAAQIKGHSAVIPTDVQGAPLFNFALVIVNADDHSLLIADSDNDVFPNRTLGDSLTSAERTLIKAVLNRRGLPFKWVDNVATFGELLRTIGRYLDTNFRENKLDVA